MVSVCLSVRPSLHLSVTLLDQEHICWKSWKLIARTSSPTPSLFVDQGAFIDFQGNMGRFGKTRGGVGKMACWSTKAAISLKRVKIIGNVRTYVRYRGWWRAHRKLGNRNSPTLFRTGPSPNPYGLPFNKIGVRTPPGLKLLLSHDWVKPQTSNLAYIFRGSIRTKAH